ncbi:MAG TPA: GNAT family N-acetyltransferase [Acidimicrobiales bacterium]|nr:GNAT family N-acetyltransferase [Acidimicrobiales bacterium]
MSRISIAELRDSRRVAIKASTDKFARVRDMNLEIREEPIASLREHAEIPIAYLVDKILEVSVSDGGLGGIILQERAVDAPYIKDYDAIKGEGPTRWPKRFDVTNWGLIAVYESGTRVGGAVIAFKTPNLEMLGEESGVAALWDIRIRPDVRHSGIGSFLFRAVREWARARGCTQIRIETQNVNLPACHFYAGMGCVLESIKRFAYPELPEEAQILWRVDL